VHYNGTGCIDLTDDEFREMYLILRREEKKGIPSAWAGDVVTVTRPRIISGLATVEKYFKDEAAKKRVLRIELANLRLQDRVEELEHANIELQDRMKKLEAYVQGLRDAEC
jgi:hypothetical protein